MKRRELKKIRDRTLAVINRPMIEFEVGGVKYTKPAPSKKGRDDS